MQFPFRSPRPAPPVFDGPYAWTQDNRASFARPIAQDSDYALRSGYYSGFAALDGPHFRVPHHFYPGVTADYHPMTGEGMNARQIGGEIVMRPPIIPRRNATRYGIGNALIFQMMYSSSGGPQNVPYIPTPQLPRR